MLHKPTQSRVALGKHPLHPMLVVFPIAFLIATPLADLALWWSGDVFWGRVAFWLVAVGVGGGIAAAAAGLLEFLLVRRVRERLAGWTHLLAAVMALSLGAANLRLRWDDPVEAALPWGLFLSTLTAMMVALAGWLGGTLTFGHGIGTYPHPHEQQAAGEAERSGPR